MKLSHFLVIGYFKEQVAGEREVIATHDKPLNIGFVQLTHGRCLLLQWLFDSAGGNSSRCRERARARLADL